MWIFVKTKVLATKSNAKSGFDQENFSIIVSGISLEDPGAKLSWAKGSFKWGDVVIRRN